MENKMIIDDVKSTMKMEGLELAENDIELMNDFLENKITLNEGIEKIKSEFIM